MALKDTNPTEEYPYIFLLSQYIGQQVPEMHGDSPFYNISVTWTSYKISETGKVIFNPSGQHTYDDDNFASTTMNELALGNSSHADTLAAQQLSIKSIIEKFTGKALEIV